MDVQEDLRGRKSAAARITEILDIADRLVLEAGALPISMRKVGDGLGASRALVYAYFNDPEQLAGAVIERQVERLEQAGLAEAARAGPFEARALACAAIYLEHVARFGPVLHIAVRDLSQTRDGRARPHVVLMARLARAARSDLRLGAHEALVLVELLLAIPEEAGRLVFEGRLGIDEARALCARLTASSIQSVLPRRSA